jgi:glycosyltransferase involved in cell wall biosynthesis
VSFVVVVHPQDVSRFDNVVGRFTLRVGITDDDLLTLYQHATLFIQPLWDGTANTALLEAISCGLPPIITDIGAIRDYVNEDCACLVPPFEPYAMLDAILHLLRNDIAREHMAIACRARALLFDWLPVSQRIRDVYTRIITGP